MAVDTYFENSYDLILSVKMNIDIKEKLSQGKLFELKLIERFQGSCLGLMLIYN